MKQNPLSPEDFQRATAVSRETLDRFHLYADLLRKWQARINLVGPATMPDLWRRHFLDSAQLFSLVPKGTRTLVDLGSGAGFPGLVLALMGVPDVHLIDSDQRKTAFLREVARVAGVNVTIHDRRSDAVAPFAADVITSRALSALPQLLEMAQPFLAPTALCLFPKGQNVEVELTEAHKMWIMDVSRHPSVTDPAAVLLALREVRRVHPT